MSNTTKITTVCYNTPREWDNADDAKAFYLEAMANSEGAERERYCNIYCKLMSGETYCTDSVDE